MHGVIWTIIKLEESHHGIKQCDQVSLNSDQKCST